ncbi:MAG: shikimate dehydrogenase [Pseudomonadota bacterium]
MSLRYAVFGHPVAHSRSPQIHAAFAAKAGIDLVYERIDAAPGDFARAVEDFARAGGRGANVTLPHKPAALALCDAVAPRAVRAGAVNTLIRLGDAPDGRARWQGDNTDGIGLVRDLRDRHGLVLEGAHVLLLGAGGAGAGVAPALLEAGIARLWVANRGIARAQALVARLDDARAAALALPTAEAAACSDDVATPGLRTLGDGDACPEHGTGLPDAGTAPRGGAVPSLATLAGARVDLVINATSAARGGAAPWQALHALMPRVAAAVDLGYREAARPFLEFAREGGAARRIDGLGMLVEQAAESFRLWHGLMPAVSPVLARLRAELGDPP